jgi:hypothetical protein
LSNNFSAKNLLINSHQAHQIAAHPFRHLPMGLSDDNPSSFGDHHGFGCHSGLDGLASCWQDLTLLLIVDLVKREVGDDVGDWRCLECQWWRC